MNKRHKRQVILFTVVMAAICLFILATPLMCAKKGHASEFEKTIFEVFSHEKQVFQNTGCEETQTCDLKRFTLVVENYVLSSVPFDISETHYGVRIRALYETTSRYALKKYAIVQFIRGCIYRSKINKSGFLEKSFGTVKKQFGNFKYFCFPEWVIDSIDKDPIYNSFHDSDRHFYFRWNKISGSFDKKSEVFYGDEFPPTTQLYIKDSPSQAYYWKGGAQNVSLKFQTCIYRTDEVPEETVETDIKFAMPVHCFDWGVDYVFNFKNMRFEALGRFDPFCLQKPPEW